jgi:hypothetical protein
MTVLRPGKTLDGFEVRAHLRRLVRRIRLHWPETVITIRGDSHYGRFEAMQWCEQNGVRYVFGLQKNKALDALVQVQSETVEADWAACGAQGEAVRGYAEMRYDFGTWSRTRRVVARIEVTDKGLDIHHVVTNIEHCASQWLYDGLYCARGQTENLIKQHKSQLAAERTSCRLPLANQMRLILHTAAYRLMRVLRDAIPRPHKLVGAEFATIPLQVRETASRVRLAHAANCPEAALVRGAGRGVDPAPNIDGGADAPR